MKDPAFLFYPKDFIIGTQFLSDAEVGLYIRILCAMHQHGRLNELQFNSLCHGNATALLMDKFCKDENGLYYNQRLDAEMTKRSKYSEKQSVKAKIRWSGESHGNATALPTVNANANVDVDNNKGVKFKKPELAEIEQYLSEKHPNEPLSIASHFYDHYQSNGWKVGKNSMKDWQGAVRNWLRNKKRYEHKSDEDKPVFGRLSKRSFDLLNPSGKPNPYVEAYFRGNDTKPDNS